MDSVMQNKAISRQNSRRHELFNNNNNIKMNFASISISQNSFNHSYNKQYAISNQETVDHHFQKRITSFANDQTKVGSRTGSQSSRFPHTKAAHPVSHSGRSSAQNWVLKRNDKHLRGSMHIQSRDKEDSVSQQEVTPRLISMAERRNPGYSNGNLMQKSQERLKLNTQGVPRHNIMRSSMMDAPASQGSQGLKLPIPHQRSTIMSQYSKTPRNLGRVERKKQRNNIYNLLDNLSDTNNLNLRKIRQSVNQLQPEIQSNMSSYRTPREIQSNILVQSVFQKHQQEVRNQVNPIQNFIVRRKKQLSFTKGSPAVQLVMPDVKTVDPEQLHGQHKKSCIKVAENRPNRRNALDLVNYQTTKSKMKQYEDIHNIVEQRLTQQSGESKKENQNSQGADTIPTELTEQDHNNSLSSCELLELERKRQFMKVDREKALMIQSSNNSPDPMSEIQSEKTDDVTGLKIHQYLLEVDFIQVQIFIMRLQKAREESDIIGTAVNEIAEQCKIEPSQLYDSLKNFILRKQQYLKDKQKIELAQSDLNHDSPTRCKVLRAINPDLVHDHELEDIPNDCDHLESREDKLDRFIQDYKRFFAFKEQLKEKLKAQTSNDDAIQSILNSLRLETNRDILSKELFEDEINMKKILEDPLLNVIESEQEYQKELARYDPRLSRAVDPSSKKFPDRNIVNINKTINISNKAKSILTQVSVMLEKDKKPPPSKVKLNFNNLQEHIAEQRNKDKSQITVKGSLGGLENLQKMLKLRQMELSNIKVLLKLNYAKQIQNQTINAALYLQRPSYLEDISLLEENKVEAEIAKEKRDYDLGGYDEQLLFRANEYMDRNTALLKSYYTSKMNTIVKRHKDIICHVQSHHNSAERESEKIDDTQNSFEMLANNTDAFEIHDVQTSLNMFWELEEKENFFQKAKQEIQGNNLPATQDSIFYRKCQQRMIMPKPLFKMISNNQLTFDGESLTNGYTQALASFIRGNIDQSKHILDLSLSSCGLKDQDFAIILDAILNNQTYEPSIQGIHYAQNEIGQLTIEQMRKVMDLGKVKRLEIVSPQIKRQYDIKNLIDSITYLDRPTLQVLKLENMNLNDHKIIEDLSELLNVNEKLHILSLENCNLFGKNLVTILGRILEHYSIKRLNISNNGHSNIIEANQVINVQIVNLVSQLIKGSRSIQYLDLSHLLLGKPLLHIISELKESLSMEYVDLSGNQIGDAYQFFIDYELRMTNKENQCLEAAELVMMTDQFFSRAHVKHSKAHLNEAKDHSEQFYSHMVNTGIIKNIRQKLKNLPSVLHNLEDKLILTRSPFNTELVFNELGKDDLSSFDYMKPFNWQRCETQRDIMTNGQYLIVAIDLRNYSLEFSEVQDKDEIKLLQSYYGLDQYQKVYRDALNNDDPSAKILRQPLVFGTITKFKIFQMMQLYKFATILITNLNEERQVLEEHIFDDVNNSLSGNFKNIFNKIISVTQSFIKVENAQVVGLGLQPHTLLSSHDARSSVEDFMTNQCFLYTTRIMDRGAFGKHSIYIYLPETNKFLKKIIVVDPQTEQFVQKSREEKSKSSMTLDLDRLKSFVGSAKEFVSRNLPDDVFLMKSFKTKMQRWALEDLAQLELKDHKSMTDKKIVEDVVLSFTKHYEVLLTLYFEVLSECPNPEYPFIMPKYLRAFCQKTKLVDTTKSDIASFHKLDRPKFFRFILFVYLSQYTDKVGSFKDFIFTHLMPLIEQSKFLTDKCLFDEQISRDIGFYLNGQDPSYRSCCILNICTYLAQVGTFSMQTAHQKVLNKVPISSFNLFKFFKLSDSTRQNSLSVVEFMEFVMRISLYIWDESNYEEGEPRENPDNFDLAPHDKFIACMEMIIGDKDGEQVNDNEEQNILKFVDIKSVRDNFEKTYLK